MMLFHGKVGGTVKSQKMELSGQIVLYFAVCGRDEFYGPGIRRLFLYLGHPKGMGLAIGGADETVVDEQGKGPRQHQGPENF